MDVEWDDRNLRHVLIDSPHGLTPSIVEAVATGAPKLFGNRAGQGRSGSNLMIGPDRDGRFWTTVLLALGDDRWRPITGWPSTGSEIRLYREEA